ncbi:hypothetical protein [Mitsuaria sp. GD03876]|uniref:hypothetical protein n=1 Tax=Mitsuaria sp. GD03876 TaxID=2975399 RepID=UPI0024487A66|nr:hypothetical protein [Mitsuaria sp. GD03876]MDH0865431.1 hypothetical protein [Mitsuaria sp. GD03876]
MSKAFTEAGQPDVVKWEVLPVTDGERLCLVFESARAGGRHGVWLMTDAGLVVNGQRAPSMDIWQDSAPQIVEITVGTSAGALHLYNIWDTGDGRGSQSWSSGMRVEELPTGRRYRCNDIGFDGPFDDLVFRIERMSS